MASAPGCFCGLLFEGVSLGRTFAEFQKMRDEAVLAKFAIARLYWHLNRPFSEILPRGDKGEMLKKVGRLYGLQKHPGAKWHRLLISMHLKGKHRTIFWCKLRLHKCPYSRVMTNLARTSKSAIFGNFAKGGPRENAQKSRPTIRASKKPWRKWHHLLIIMHLKGKHRTTFWCKLRLHKCPYSRFMTNLARTPKSAIFWDFAKRGPREVLKKVRRLYWLQKHPGANDIIS